LEYQLKDLSERELLTQAGLSAKALQGAVRMIRSTSGGIVALSELYGAKRDAVRALAVLLLSLGKLGVADSGLLLIRRGANEQGLPYVGLHPSFRPGRLPTSDNSVEQMRAEIENDKISSALVVGADLLETEAGARLLEKIPSRVVLDMFLTKTAASADVVLPISAPVETAGRFVTLERRIRQMKAFGTVPVSKATWEVLSLLRERLGGRNHGGTFEELAHELDAVCSLSDVLGATEDGTPLVLFAERFQTSTGTAYVADEGAVSRETVGFDYQPSATIERRM
jgi:predicted molibdopterin-dependent oxidoreductase YjgC